MSPSSCKHLFKEEGTGDRKEGIDLRQFFGCLLLFWLFVYLSIHKENESRENNSQGCISKFCLDWSMNNCGTSRNQKWSVKNSLEKEKEDASGLNSPRCGSCRISKSSSLAQSWCALHCELPWSRSLVLYWE